VLDEDGKEFTSKGDRVEDYYCFNKVIIAPADGLVEEIHDGIADNEIGEVNLDQNWGNSLVIKHTPWLYSQLSHIKSGSFQVEKGDSIKKGQVLAHVGNSGRSPSPHLHFQIQATPFVGSETLEYPISNYMVNDSGNKNLRINTIPKENQLVQNIEVDNALKKAFGFIPGQKLAFTHEDNKTEWEVGIDYFNNTYLHCPKTQSSAFFDRKDNELIFTSFKGDKKSLLFKFYLAAYHVVFGFSQEMQIEDVLPANTMKRNGVSIIQDFIAPFYLFIKPKFIIDYMSKESYFDENKIVLQSQILNRKGIEKFNFLFKIDEKGIQEWIINMGDKSSNFKSTI